MCGDRTRPGLLGPPRTPAAETPKVVAGVAHAVEGGR